MELGQKLVWPWHRCLLAKTLLKTEADDCLANEAVPKMKLELFHQAGDNCSEGGQEGHDVDFVFFFPQLLSTSNMEEKAL